MGTVGWSVLVAAVAASASGGWRVLRWLVVPPLLAGYIYNSNVRMGHWVSPSVLFRTDAVHLGRSSKVLHAKASELQAAGALHEALEYYLKSLDVFDDQAITDYCIARILLNLGREQEAANRFDKILNGHGIGFHDNNDFLWMTDLGYTFVKLGNPEPGLHYLQEGLNRMPWSCYAWNAKGVAHAQLAQLQDSANALTHGLECDPASPSIWSNLAVVYAYGNQLQQANEALQKALELNATYPAAVHNAQVLTGRAQQGTLPTFDLYIPLPGRR